MPDKDETITIHQNRTEFTWAGVLEKRKLRLFNLQHTSIQKSIEYPQLIFPHDRLAVCVFNCSNPNQLYGYNFSHRLNRSRDSATSVIVNEAKMLRFLDAMSKIGSDLTGLTAKRLKNIRTGMNFVSRMPQTSTVFSYDPRFLGGVFVATYMIEDRIYDWNKSQELRSGK